MTRSLWAWAELCHALGIEQQPPNSTTAIDGFCIDSRRVQPGDLFIALSGDLSDRFTVTSRSNRDGHEYVADAFVGGAVAALVKERALVNIDSTDARLIAVPDVIDGLWQIGRAARARMTARVVAVTGSSGKTTAKSYLQRMLPAFASAGSLNNHLGVPLSLAANPVAPGVAVFEIGTNHPGEIAPLVNMVSPDVALLLNVSSAHIGNFKNLSALTEEKFSIASGLRDGGVLIVHDEIDLQQPVLRHIADQTQERCELIRFGTRPGSDVQLQDLVAGVASYNVRGRQFKYRVPGGGQHRALTCGGCIAVALALGLPIEELALLDDSSVPQGRGNEIQIGQICIIDDSYNANVASMTAALQDSAERTGPTYALLGAMGELGVDSDRFHQQLAAHCIHLTGVWCVGSACLPLYESLPEALQLGFYEEVSPILTESIQSTLPKPCNLLIKGSNSVFWAHNYVQQLTLTLRDLKR